MTAYQRRLKLIIYFAIIVIVSVQWILLSKTLKHLETRNHGNLMGFKQNGGNKKLQMHKCDVATSASEMVRRRNQLRKNCPKITKQPRTGSGLLVNDKYKILLCDVAKIGSTFLKKMWYILDKNLTEKDPMNLKKNIFSVRFKRLANFNVSERRKRIDSYTKLMFTRNPYSRLFSAHQNKFVTVNPSYWKKAKTFIKGNRHNPKDISLQCGHDLTFEEFLSLVAQNRNDAHWKPLVTYCDPCAVDYDVIGTMESFNEDLQHFLCKIKAEDKIDLPTVNPMVLRKFNVKLEVSDSVGKIKQIDKKCIPKSELAYRVVQNMVSHGYIEYMDKNDLKKLPTDYTQQDLVDFIYDHMNKSSTEKLLSLPKMEQDKAFRSVPAGVLNKIKDIYGQDFKLFGYNMSEY